MTQNPEITEQYGTDPLALFQKWYDEAAPLEPNDPDAIALATATEDGVPSVRMVLLKEFSSKGFKFHTNCNSTKGQDLLSNPQASFAIYWKSTRKQIRVGGRVSTVSEAESDEYFKTRPRARAIGAWASAQSESYARKIDLQNAIAEQEERFKDMENVPRPPHWKGFLIEPQSIEFWIGNRDRLHTRFVYSKNSSDGWDSQWLYP